ncbi:MAG: tetratricopeptide repeat protein [Kiloniellaceae bacterium]
MTTDRYKEALKEAYQEMEKNSPDYGKVEKLLQEEASKGNPLAKYGLGTWYLHGAHGIEKNVARGVGLIKEAAVERVPEACYDMAVSYETGKGAEKDTRLAFRYYLLAALYGDSTSFREVGRCYNYGIGVDKDEEIADCWWERAESLGVEP